MSASISHRPSNIRPSAASLSRLFLFDICAYRNGGNIKSSRSEVPNIPLGFLAWFFPGLQPGRLGRRVLSAAQHGRPTQTHRKQREREGLRDFRGNFTRQDGDGSIARGLVAIIRPAADRKIVEGKIIGAGRRIVVDAWQIHRAIRMVGRIVARDMERTVPARVVRTIISGILAVMVAVVIVRTLGSMIVRTLIVRTLAVMVAIGVIVRTHSVVVRRVLVAVIPCVLRFVRAACAGIGRVAARAAAAATAGPETSTAKRPKAIALPALAIALPALAIALALALPALAIALSGATVLAVIVRNGAAASRRSIIVGFARTQRAGSGIARRLVVTGVIAAVSSIIVTRVPDISGIVMAGLAVAVLVIADACALIRRSESGREHQREQGHQEHSQYAQDRQSDFETLFRHGMLVKQGRCRSHEKLISGLISGG